MPRRAILLLICIASLVSCSRSDHALSPSQESGEKANTFSANSDRELVRQAIENHVQNDRHINLSAMDMTVDQVNVKGDRAQADVTFRARQGGATMAMTYLLERQANGWQVIKGQPADGQFLHPPIDQADPGTSSSPSVPPMPDVQEFLKNHPTTSPN
jgi:hypothetical protein